MGLPRNKVQLAPIAEKRSRNQLTRQNILTKNTSRLENYGQDRLEEIREMTKKDWKRGSATSLPLGFPRRR